jgi:hypothetical protein
MKSRSELATWGVAAAFLLLTGALPARAGVGVSIAPSYPLLVDVGDTGLAAELEINNGSDGPEAAEQLNISNIQHTPACAVSDFPCPAGSKDPGVFQVNSPATGSDACAGMTFNVAITDASTGTVTFTPQSGSVVLQPKNAPNDSCTIHFTIDVLKLPTLDSSSGPGIMTNQLARVSAQAAMSGTTGSGTGTNQTTVRAPADFCEECLSEAPAVGAGGLAVLSLLLLAGGLGAMRRRRARS